jgi:hypothetical protein
MHIEVRAKSILSRRGVYGCAAACFIRMRTLSTLSLAKFHSSFKLQDGFAPIRAMTAAVLLIVCRIQCSVQAIIECTVGI